MQLFTVREAVDEAFFSSQAGDERQVRLTGLNAELADLMVHAGAQFVLVDALALEHQLENLRDGLLLEDAPVRAQVGPGQLGLDQRVIVGAVEAAFSLAESADQAVHVAHRAFAVPDGKKYRLVEQVAEVDIVFEADQFQLQLEGHADPLSEFERHHFEFSFSN
ncbi:hypothetical protein D3C80_1706680 [compost metagenome]